MPVKHRRYQPHEVIELTRAAIHAFTSRDMAGFDGLLDPDFSFVGDDAPLFLHGTEEFFNSTQNERKSPPVSITGEDYMLLAHEKSLWVTSGRFQAVSPPLRSSIHFTFVWRQREEALLLLHASAFHAHPPADAKAAENPQAHMFDLPPAVKMDGRAEPKHPYRDLNGHIRYLSDREILYCRSSGKICEIHSGRQPPFSMRTTLHALERPGFLVIHRSYLVNLSHVREICRYRAVLQDGTELPIGREHYLPLKRILAGTKP